MIINVLRLITIRTYIYKSVIVCVYVFSLSWSNKLLIYTYVQYIINCLYSYHTEAKAKHEEKRWENNIAKFECVNSVILLM